VSTVEKNVVIHLMNEDSGYGMLRKLKNLFEQDDEQRKLNLLSKFKFKWTKTTAADNVAELNNISMDLKSCKMDITPEMIIAKVLTILPERFAVFSSAWESMNKEEKTMKNLIARLTNEEGRHQGNENEKSGDTVFKLSKDMSISLILKTKVIILIILIATIVIEGGILCTTRFTTFPI